MFEVYMNWKELKLWESFLASRKSNLAAELEMEADDAVTIEEESDGSVTVETI